MFSLGLQQLDFDIVYFGAWLAAKGFSGIFELSAENSLTIFKVVMNYNVREPHILFADLARISQPLTF